VIAPGGAITPAADTGGVPGPGPITVETLIGADTDSGRFWRDAER
jgi:hypothetical protein